MLKAFADIKAKLRELFDLEAFITQYPGRYHCKIVINDWLDKYQDLAYLFNVHVDPTNTSSRRVFVVRLEFTNGTLDIFAPKCLVETIRQMLSGMYFDMSKLIEIKTTIEENNSHGQTVAVLF